MIKALDQWLSQGPLQAALELSGRLGLAAIFINAGYGKIGAGYAGTQGYMEAMGVSGALLPLVIALELGGGLLIAFGFCTRLLALLLAGFCILSALIFHLDFGNSMQAIMFMKNIAIAGGFAVLAAHGAGRWSLDQWRR